MKIIVTTYPYNSDSFEIRELMKEINLSHKCTVKFNKQRRKYTQQELVQTLREEQPDIIIAGTETYGSEQLDLCPNLKMISRVGIGLDSVDLKECAKRGIIVTNTPDAPSNAVAELTISQILTSLRYTNIVDQEMKDYTWKRIIGREVKNCCVGVIGVGRIGSLVIKKLEAFCPKRIMYADVDPLRRVFDRHVWTSKEQIIKECDVITVHIPLNEENRNYIGKKELSLMKSGSVLINTSRGGIINERALYEWLKNEPSSFAAVDVFEQEPYTGKLLELPNIIVSPHLGSCTRTSRHGMETDALKEVSNFLHGVPPMSEAML